MKNVIAVTPVSFEAEVLQAQTPVLVDFFTEWCGPCAMLAPVLERLAAGFAGRVKFVKVDVDTAPELAAAYQITGVPTLALFRQGQLVDAVVGFVSPQALKTWLEGAALAPAQTPAVPRP